MEKQFAPLEIWSDPAHETTETAFSQQLNSSHRSGGLFVGRLGGSDFEAVSQWHSKLQHFKSAPLSVIGKMLGLDNRAPYSSPFTRQHIERVRNLNGFFDVKDEIDVYANYLEAMHDAYLQTKCFTYGGKNVLDAVDGGEKRHPFFEYLSTVSQGKTLITYSFIESVEPFVRSMHSWAKGKKILVVSPFARSVTRQWERRDDLLTRVRFPDFQLSTYQTPITYSTLRNFRERPPTARTDNWNQEASLIIEEVLEMDFDIALISCASYSMPLGAAISNSNRKAIYLGGALNPMFNILGARYKLFLESGLVNPETTIHPLESENFRDMTAGRKFKNEALRAYLP